MVASASEWLITCFPQDFVRAPCYYPAYSGVLREDFSPDTTWLWIGPQRFKLPPLDDPTGSFGSYVVEEIPGVPVFVLEMRAPDKLYSTSSRKEADAHIRERIAVATPKCPLATYHAVCAFGTRLCFYTGTIRDGRVHIEPPSDIGPPPLSRWDCDVLELEGVACFRAVADEAYAYH